MAPLAPLDPGPDLAADAATADAVAALAAATRTLPLPPAQLTGWSSLCAAEYGRAMVVLQRTVQAAADALARAGRR